MSSWSRRRRIAAAELCVAESGFLGATGWFFFSMWRQFRPYYHRQGIYLFRVEPSLDALRFLLAGALLCGIAVQVLRLPRPAFVGQLLALTMTLIAGYSTGVLRPGLMFYFGPSRLPWAAALFLVACALTVACLLHVRPRRAPEISPT